MYSVWHSGFCWHHSNSRERPMQTQKILGTLNMAAKILGVLIKYGNRTTPRSQSSAEHTGKMTDFTLMKD